MEIAGWIAYGIIALNLSKELFELRAMINESIPIAPQTINSLTYTLIGLIMLPVFEFHPLHIIWIYFVVNLGSPFLNLFPFNIVTPVSAFLYDMMSIDKKDIFNTDLEINKDDLLDSYVELSNEINRISEYPKELINEFLIIYYESNITHSIDPMDSFNEAFIRSGSIESSLHETANTEAIFKKKQKVESMIPLLEEVRNEEPKNFKMYCKVAIDTFKYDIDRAMKKAFFVRNVERFIKSIFMKKRPDLLSLAKKIDYSNT